VLISLIACLLMRQQLDRGARDMALGAIRLMVIDLFGTGAALAKAAPPIGGRNLVWRSATGTSLYAGHHG
jgi:hypothetical protein